MVDFNSEVKKEIGVGIDSIGNVKGCDKAVQCSGGCRQLSNFTTGNKYESIYCCYK